MKTEKSENLMDGLLSEMNRVRELITEYKSLPGGVGMIGASIMNISIQQAEKSITNGNVIEIIRAYEQLKSHC